MFVDLEMNSAMKSYGCKSISLCNSRRDKEKLVVRSPTLFLKPFDMTVNFSAQ